MSEGPQVADARPAPVTYSSIQDDRYRPGCVRVDVSGPPDAVAEQLRKHADRLVPAPHPQGGTPNEQVAAEPSTTPNASAVSSQDGGERMNGEAAGTGPLPAHLHRVVVEAVDLCWKATPGGQTADGDVAHYLLPKGVVHRLVGALQGAGYSASLRIWHHVEPTARAGKFGFRCTCGASVDGYFTEEGAAKDGRFHVNTEEIVALALSPANPMRALPAAAPAPTGGCSYHWSTRDPDCLACNPAPTEAGEGP